MPRKPRVARVRLGNVVIDVYSIEALERLLKELKEVKPVKPVEQVETIKPAQDNIADTSDFLANNPWLSIISKRGSE